MGVGGEMHKVEAGNLNISFITVYVNNIMMIYMTNSGNLIEKPQIN